MDSLKKQIEAFDRCCEDAKSSPYIVATTKLKEILKCIARSPKLYQLFNEMTKNFDYADCCRRCLITESNGLFSRSYVALPDDPDECLPFIFCLLIEFDREDYQGFNDFLRKYFNEDGSYVSCYENFCLQITDTLRDIIDSMYAESVQKSRQEHLSDNVYTSAVPDAASAPAGPGASAQIAAPQSAAQKPAPAASAQSFPTPPAGASDMSSLISDEHMYVAMTDIPDSDKKAAMAMLDELDSAVKAGNFSTANALIAGYNYFALFNNVVSDILLKIIFKLHELER
ncbi:MAG: hypothetical protein LUE27_10175 [Clostridia bacterium]|nr:hypothetical protein [Clostridia bacterium]